MRKQHIAAIFVLFFTFSFISSSAFAQGDADWDGITDAEDACPNEGDWGLGLDAAGCPYKDTDGDSVFDRDDSCPARADESGYGVGADGCPLAAPTAPNNPPPADNGGNNNNPPPPPEPRRGENNPLNPDGDADGDGFPNQTDACPWQGDEGGLGVDIFGCPYYDADWDGVIDRLDACPWQSDEDGMGIDETGCPYYDVDRDGVIDRDDACPFRGNEGSLGVDETGCPYYDADWDGVFDRNDACPYKGNTSGYGIEANGCPRTEAQIAPSIILPDDLTNPENNDVQFAQAIGDMLPVGESLVIITDADTLTAYILDANGNIRDVDAIDYMLNYINVRRGALTLLDQLTIFFEETTDIDAPRFTFEGVEWEIPAPQILDFNISNPVIKIEAFDVEVLDVLSFIVTEIIDEFADIPNLRKVLELPPMFLLVIEPVDVEIPCQIILVCPVEFSTPRLKLNMLQTIFDVIDLLQGDYNDENLPGIRGDLLRFLTGKLSVGTTELLNLVYNVVDFAIGDYGNRYDEINLGYFEVGAALNYYDYVPYEDKLGELVVKSTEIVGDWAGTFLGTLAGGPVGGYIGQFIGKKIGTLVGNQIDAVLPPDPDPVARPSTDTIIRREDGKIILEIGNDDILDLEFLIEVPSDPVMITFTQIDAGEIFFTVSEP